MKKQSLMLFPKFTNDQIVKRLRWVMATMVMFTIANTIAGQPGTFWHNPATAMRGDGLSINNPTNHTFGFFLGYGWLPFLVASLTFLLMALLLVSVVPRKPALVIILTIIFGYYYEASNWLAVRWHLGFQGPILYGLAVSMAIVYTAFQPNLPVKAIKSLRWIMLFATLTDATFTLWGQPSAYWHRPNIVDEGNQVSRFFLMHGWYSYLAEQAVICFALYWLVSVLSRPWGLFVALCFILGGFAGASNWLFYRWLLGMEAPVLFGAVLSFAIVLFTFSSESRVEGATDSAERQKETRIPSRRKGWLLRECY
jgi:hypothetical protein